ncbi:hypothetical protein ACFL43_02970, partial [Thermodesulfobacteriota bacterium]
GDAMVDSFFDSLPEYIELIMGYAPALFMIIVPVAVFIAYQNAKSQTRKARESAGRLGLQYINVADEMKDKKPNDAFLLGLLSKWSTWAMEGSYNGVSVRVEQVVKTKQTRRIAREGDLGMSNPTSTSYARGTTYDAVFPQPLPFDIRIRQNITIEFPFMKRPEIDSIQSGDTELDQMVVISGSDAEKIRGWLGSAHIKNGLRDVYRALPSANVDNRGLHYYELKGKPDYENIKNKLDVLCGAALNIGKA